MRFAPIDTGFVLKLALEDKEMILLACANSFGEALQFVDESFCKERDFMIEAR